MQATMLRIFAAAAQPTHVHLVLAPLREDVKNVIARLKRRATMAAHTHRRISINSPAILAGKELSGQNGRSIWTAGQFPIFIFDQRHLANAIEYVRDHNRRRGLSADPFDWIEPLYPASPAGGERACQKERNKTLRLE